MQHLSYAFHPYTPKYVVTTLHELALLFFYIANFVFIRRHLHAISEAISYGILSHLIAAFLKSDS